LTLIHPALAGGDCIDDADALHAGTSQGMLRLAVLAPSVLGTLLRTFSWRRARQLYRVAPELLGRA
jgi:hypothetical protein